MGLRPGRIAAVVVVVVVVVALAGRAVAAESAARPAVSLTVAVDPADAALANAVEQQLAASLAARGIGLGREGIARVRIQVTPGPNGAVAVIEIGDNLTRKRVERSLEMAPIPTDGRALAIASSADELLRASWAEIILVDAPKAPAPPPAVAAAVAASTRPVPRRYELALELGGETSRARTALASDIRAGFALRARVALLVAARASFGVARTSVHGSVRGDDLGVEGGVAFGLRPLEARRGIRLEGGVSALRMSFQAVGGPGVQAFSVSDWSVLGEARARAWQQLGAWRLTLAAGAGYPLRAARADDAGATVTSNEGVAVFAAASVGVAY